MLPQSLVPHPVSCQVIETMLLPHVDASSATTDDRAAHRAAIVDEALRIFLSRCVNLPGNNGNELDAGSGRDRSHSFKGRKSKRRVRWLLSTHVCCP